MPKWVFIVLAVLVLGIMAWGVSTYGPSLEPTPPIESDR